MTALAVLLAVSAALVWPRGDGDRSSAGAQRWGGRLRSRVAGRARSSGTDWVADLAELAAVGLQAGLDLRSAAEVAARSPGVAQAAPWLLDRLADAGRRGSGTAEALADPPVPRPVAADLALLARAWHLSEVVGATASRTTEGAAAALRARTAAQARARAALAGPRASMRVLTALPLAGPVAGLALGLSPTSLYGSAAARASALVGVLLALAGWLWAAWLYWR
ncbi:MAG: hypothetical protein IE926_16490, partial [Micrococcales bacterium]|nr:hypothetical protein [Micrococcales bacterium]